uniref:NADH-ubiquinone oxidoreductase chain 5 n=1 Tax=Falconius longicornis TaxID=2793211 RepID=A0A7U3QC62_9ORTH|nr:NADH dehydrogenase subunit 5 [Falconius longicornis]
MLNIFYLVFLIFMSACIITFLSGVWFIYMDYSIFVEWEVFSLNSSTVVMAVILDWMSMIFISFVLGISSVVLLYSNGYMYGDMSLSRFVILIVLFVLSMLFLIVSPNLISILLGWDGLGLVSYCLVIYYQSYNSVNAGLLTALSNRVGDVFILLSVSWMLNFGSWNYIYYYDFFNYFDYKLICYMVVLAAMTSSAQLPFSAWLPAAMAAPTPVSALVHSSTLVTAGVYLMIRFSPVLYFSGASYFLLFFGCLTMFMSGLAANYEFDLSSIIALSTLSQLGFMMGILSMGFPMLSFFHLLTHALFKSLLFLCAGCYIHVICNYQDIRYMGSMTLVMPYTSICFNVSVLSLCGFPFLSGYYSSDLALEFCSMLDVNFMAYVIFLVSVGLTAMYSVRLVYYSLCDLFSFHVLRNLHDLSYDMHFSMLILLLFSVFGGSLLSWLIFPVPNCVYLSKMMKLMTLFMVMLGAYVGYLVSLCSFVMSYSFGFVDLQNFMGSMWFMPFISTNSLSLVVLEGGGQLSSYLDYGWLEYYGAQGLYGFMLYFIRYYLYMFDYNFSVYVVLFSLFFFIVIFYVYLF